MKRIIKTLAVGCLGLLAGSGATAQTLIEKYQPGVTPEGAVYYLPKTMLRITVQVEKTTFTPGELCAYAQKFLKLKDAGQQKLEAYRVTSLGLTSYGVADTSKCYSVKFNAKSIASNMELADDGTLLAVNASPLRLAAPKPFEPVPKPAPKDAKAQLGEEILSAGSTAKMAELVAQEIYEIRDSKNLLTRGQADFMPKDGEQLRIMLAQLEEQDQLLTSLFAGTTVKDTVEYVLDYCPQKGVQKEVLFRLSKMLGMVDADDLSGVPYYISIEDKHIVAEPQADPKAKKKKTLDGLYVNVPGKIKVTIEKGTKQMGSFDVYAGQYGNTELLSGELFSKKHTVRLTLHPTTGAVHKLEAEEPQ